MLAQYFKNTFGLRSKGRIQTWLRLVLGTISVLAAIPLVIALQLEPSEKGFGTHQQLGFSPCRFKDMYGVPCPSCGMTTSWSFIVRGNWQQSLQANAAGTFLAILTMFCTVWCGLASVSGRWMLIQPHDWLFISLVIAVFLFIVVHWIFRYLI